MIAGALLLLWRLGTAWDASAGAPALQSDRARLINLLAEAYWNSGDLEQALRSLEGWDQKELANLLATMKEQTTDPQALNRLRSFEEALALPMPPLTLLSLYKQAAIAWSTNLSLALILGAILCRIWPLTWQPTLEQLGRKKAVAPQAGVAPVGVMPGLAEGQMPPATLAEGQEAPVQAAPGRAAQATEQGGPAEGSGQPQGQTAQQAGAQAAGQQAGEQAAQGTQGAREQTTTHEGEAKPATGVQGKEGAKAPAAEGQKVDGEKVKEGQGAEQKADAQKADGPKAAGKEGQQQAASGEQPKEEGLEGLTKESDEIQNILASIFEEEDESLQAIAVLCQGLEDVDIADLARRLQAVAEGLREMNRARLAAPSPQQRSAL